MIDHSVLSESEIIKLYRQSKDPVKQIIILSQLCNCTYMEMRDYLSHITPMAQDKKRFVFFNGVNLITVVWMRDHGFTWNEIEEEVGIDWRALARQIRKEGIR